MKQPREEKDRKEAPQAAPAVDESMLESLWDQFKDEAGFSEESAEQERQKLREEIAMLEERIAEKRQAIEAIDQRAQAARAQLKALLLAKLSPDAILSAMRVEYKVRRPAAPRPRTSTPEMGDDDKQLVLDHLDHDGLTVSELRKRTEKDLRFLRTALKSLVEEGRVRAEGEGSSTLYALV